MPRNSQVGMFNIPNFLGGSSVLANQGLQSSGLGGSSGSLTTVNPFGGGDPQRKNISGQPWVQEGPTKNDCLWSMQVTGSPTPCPPNHSHQPAPCGPCTVMGSPGETGVLDPTKASQTPGETNIACPEPTSPSPGKPGSHTWNQVTCTWDIRPGIDPTKAQVGGLTDEQKTMRDIITGQMQYGRQRGAQSRQELGQQFGRAGGGVGGGAMGDLELFENPLLAGGSPYLEKNVLQFAQGGRMENPYNTYPGGGRADFMAGVRRGMNSAVAAGQIQNVVRNNRSSRRFTLGGKF